MNKQPKYQDVEFYVETSVMYGNGAKKKNTYYYVEVTVNGFIYSFIHDGSDRLKFQQLASIKHIDYLNEHSDFFGKQWIQSEGRIFQLSLKKTALEEEAEYFYHMIDLMSDIPITYNHEKQNVSYVLKLDK